MTFQSRFKGIRSVSKNLPGGRKDMIHNGKELACQKK